MPLELAVEQIVQSWKRLHLGQITFLLLRHLKISRTSLQGLQDDCAKVKFADRAYYVVVAKYMIVGILTLI